MRSRRSSHRKSPTFLIEQLEQRQLLSAYIEVELANGGGHSMSIDPSNPPQSIDLVAYAIINGADSQSANDGFMISGKPGGWVFGSFVSPNIRTGSVRGDLTDALDPAFINAAGSMAVPSNPGKQQDLDGDGDLDIGGSNPTDGSSGWVIASANSVTGSDIGNGTAGAGKKIEIATLTFTLNQVLDGPPTTIDFQIRPQESGNVAADWYEDGQFKSTILGDSFAAPAGAQTGVTISVPDTQPPTASISNFSPIIAGAKSYQFTVNYSDNQSLDTSTIGTGNILVTGPNGYNQVATLVNGSNKDSDPSSTPQYDPWSATYEIPAPDQTNGWGGTTGIADNGTYTFSLQPNQLKDTAGNVAAGATLGTADLKISGDVSIAPATASVNESATSPAVFTVTRTDLLGDNFTEPMTVNYTIDPGSTAVAGTNYNISDAAGDPTGTLTIPAGQSSANISVQPIDDNIVNGGQTLTLNLNSGSQYIINGNATSTLGIVNTDTVSASIADATIARTTSDQTLNFTVTIAGTFTIPVYVDYSTSGGNAVAGTDYTAASGVLTFQPGQSLTQSVPVTVLGSTATGDRTFNVNITPDTQSAGDVTIASSPAQGLIYDIIPASAADITATSGLTGGIALFTVTLETPPLSPVTVNYTTADGTALAGTDYTATSGTLNFSTGQQIATVSVPLLPVVRSNANKTFTLNLTAGTRTTVSGTGAATATLTAPNFNEIKIDPKKGATYVDGSGNKIKVKITHGATGFILFPSGGPTTGVNAAGIEIDGATSKTNIIINGKSTTMGFIDVAGDVKNINARRVTLDQYIKTTGGGNSFSLGDLNNVQLKTGSLKNLKAGNLTNGVITIGSGQDTNLKLGAVSNSSISDASAIKNLNISGWSGGDAGVIDTLSAPGINRLNDKGDFQANVTTGLVNNVRIKGAWSNSIVTLTQIKSMTVGSASDSYLLAATTGVPPFPTVSSQFGAGGSVGKFSVQSKSAGAFSNTIIAGASMGKISLRSVAGSSGTAAFGVAAESIKSINGVISTGKFSQKNLSNSTPDSKPVTDANFLVELI